MSEPCGQFLRITVRPTEHGPQTHSESDLNLPMLHVAQCLGCISGEADRLLETVLDQVPTQDQRERAEYIALLRGSFERGRQGIRDRTHEPDGATLVAFYTAPAKEDRRG